MRIYEIKSIVKYAWPLASTPTNIWNRLSMLAFGTLIRKHLLRSYVRPIGRKQKSPNKSQSRIWYIKHSVTFVPTVQETKP